MHRRNNTIVIMNGRGSLYSTIKISKTNPKRKNTPEKILDVKTFLTTLRLKCKIFLA